MTIPHLVLVGSPAERWLSSDEAIAHTGWTDRWLRIQAAAGAIVSRPGTERAPNGKPVREYLLSSLPALQSQLALVTPPALAGPLFTGAPQGLKGPRFVLPDPKLEAQAEKRLQILKPCIEFAGNAERYSALAVNGRPVTSAERMIEYVAATNNTTPRTIKRWLAALRVSGPAALADRVRSDKGQSRWFNRHHQAAILAAYLFLNERMSVTFICEQIELNRERLGIDESDLPGRETVRLFLSPDKRDQISPAMKALAREGQREYRERMSPYLTRMYTDIFANQVLVGDTVILDIECANDTFPELAPGTPMRMRVVVFEDFRSRKIVGFNFCIESNSDAIKAALLMSFLLYGLPEMVYVDNGKDFRKVARGAQAGFVRPLSPEQYGDLITQEVLARLGIGVTHCIPRHPQSKHVERLFRTGHIRFDAIHSTYTGGSPATRPDSTELAMMQHRRLLKKGRAAESRHPYSSRIIAGFRAWVEEYNARPHSGEGMDGRSPNQVFVEEPNPEQRPTPERSKLAMLMASYERREVHECAVSLNRRRYTPRAEDRVGWHVMHEWNEREKILIAFNPSDPEFAIALDPDGRFLAWLEAEQKIRFAPNDPAVQGQIAGSMEMRRGLEKHTRTTLDAIEQAARANGAKSAEEMLYERLQIPAATGDVITHRKPRLAPTSKPPAPKTAAEVARELMGE